jgi:hypothetical protein
MSTENRGDFLLEMTYSGRGSGLYEMGYAPSYDSPDLADLYEDAAKGSSGSRSGGTSEVDNMARSFERLRSQLDPAYKAMQEMADARTSLNWALESGKITEQEHLDLLARAKDEYMATGDALADYAQEVGDFFGDFAVLVMDNIDSLDDLKAAVGDFVQSAMRDLLKLAISKGFQALMSLAFGNAGGTVFGALVGGVASGGGGMISFAGGGYTGPGTRSGGIDGLGGFPAILHPNETVIDHTKASRSNGVEINIVGNLPQGSVDQRPGRVDIQLAPMIAQVIESGGVDQVMRRRFGANVRGMGA